MFIKTKMKSIFEAKAISETLQTRKNIINIFITAAVLAFGINLVSSYFSTDVHTDYLTKIRNIGLIIILVAFIVSIRNLWKSKRVVVIDGVVTLDVVNNELIKIPGYLLSVELNNIIKAGFIENEAWRNTWNLNPLIKISNVTALNSQSNVVKLDTASQQNAVKYAAIVKTKTGPNVNQKSKDLLTEAAEFMVLDNLSTHLSDHFGKLDSEKTSPIIEFKKEHISKLVLSNRFLSLLTTPLEDRSIFGKLNQQEINSDDVITSITGTDGSIYSRFDLKLPSESKLKRKSNGELRLETKVFILEAKIIFDGYSHLLPSGFGYAYLGKNSNQIHNMKLKIQISTQVKLLSLLFSYNQSNYIWMDSFVENLCDKFSFNKFLEEINWSTVSTYLHVSQTIANTEK